MSYYIHSTKNVSLPKDGKSSIFAKAAEQMKLEVEKFPYNYFITVPPIDFDDELESFLYRLVKVSNEGFIELQGEDDSIFRLVYSKEQDKVVEISPIITWPQID